MRTALHRKRVIAEALAADAPVGAERERFIEMGPPSRRDEYWRFTDPAKLVSPLALAQPQTSRIGADAFDALSPYNIVFADGVYRPDLSDLAIDGVEITALSAGGWFAESVGHLQNRGHSPVMRPLAALNGAVAVEGVAIKVTNTPDRPLRIHHVGAGEGAGFARVVAHIDRGAAVTILEAGAGVARLNGVFEANISDEATVHHIRLQTESHGCAATHLFARLGSEAHLKAFTLSNGAAERLLRNETVVWLDGENSSAHLAGGVIAKRDGHVDNTVFLTHAAAHCESRQVFKNVVTDKAKAVFQGKILVEEGAQKTDGYQISQAVLLDERAAFLAKPELEIYADDVVCSHGSTTGALDSDALFYLKARGLADDIAKALLVKAFIEDALLEIERTDLRDLIREEAGKLVSELVS